MTSGGGLASTTTGGGRVRFERLRRLLVRVGTSRSASKAEPRRIAVVVDDIDAPVPTPANFVDAVALLLDDMSLGDGVRRVSIDGRWINVLPSLANAGMRRRLSAGLSIGSAARRRRARLPPLHARQEAGTARQ
jgi:hypothetical protein